MSDEKFGFPGGKSLDETLIDALTEFHDDLVARRQQTLNLPAVGPDGIIRFRDGSTIEPHMIAGKWKAGKANGCLIRGDGVGPKPFDSIVAAADALAAIGQGPAAKGGE